MGYNHLFQYKKDIFNREERERVRSPFDGLYRSSQKQKRKKMEKEDISKEREHT